MEKRFENPVVKNEAVKVEVPKVEVKVQDVNVVSGGNTMTSGYVGINGVSASEIELPKSITVKTNRDFLSAENPAFNIAWDIPVVNMIQLRYSIEEINSKFLKAIATPAVDNGKPVIYGDIVEELVFDDIAKGVKAILKKSVIVKRVPDTFLLDVADNRTEKHLSLECIPPKLKAMMKGSSIEAEGSDLFVLLDLQRLVSNICISGIFIGNSSYENFTKLGEIKQYGDIITFVLLIENGEASGRVNISSCNLVQANLSMTQDKFVEMAAASLSIIDTKNNVIKFVKTNKIYESNIGKEAKDNLLSMQEGIPLINCPILKLSSAEYLEDNAGGGNFLLDQYASSTKEKKLNTKTLMSKFGCILDREIFQYKDTESQFILPNLKKLVMYTCLGKIRTEFKVSLKTDTDHISIALSI